MSSKPEKHGSLEIGLDMDFQRKEWVAQRIAWVAFSLIILASLLGLTGPGPLSDTTLQTDQFTAEVKRFVRRASPEEFRVEVSPEAAASGQVQLALNREFVDQIQIDRIEPEPDSVEASGDQYIYTFQVASGQPAGIQFHYQALTAGLRPLTISLVGGPGVTVSQFTYP